MARPSAALRPDHVDASKLAIAAADQGVIYFPGQWFYPDENHSNTIRLSFSTVPEDRILEGVRRLGDTLRTVLNN